MVWSINHRKIILPLGVAFGESNFSFKSTTIDSCYPLLYIQTTKWGGPYTEVLCLAVAKELLLGVQLSEAMGSEGGGGGEDPSGSRTSIGRGAGADVLKIWIQYLKVIIKNNEVAELFY